MGTEQPSDSSERGERPGKMRTMWHPLLVRMLDFALSPAFTVREEVSVGKMPLQVDILLIRREEGQLSEVQATEISPLLPLLNRYTLVEFKGPTDAMERGDFGQLAGCSFLWHSQETEAIAHEDVSLVVLAPTVTKALRDELRLLGLTEHQHEPGILRVEGFPFAVWLVETDLMAERGQPVLSLVSRVFLNDRERIMDKLDFVDERLVIYAAQQIRQFRKTEGFALQYADSEYLEQLEDDLVSKFLEETPPERRLRGLPLKERLAGLSGEEKAKLLELLQSEEDKSSGG